jgi:rubrerythrin
MIKIFEDFDITLVGHYQSVLETNNIATFMKNQFGTSGAGELPFVEVIPQLWVLNEADAERAKSLIGELDNPDSNKQPEAWTCPDCGIALEAAFTHCWKCSVARP